jgi:predicted PurR-regulated permease PerM
VERPHWPYATKLTISLLLLAFFIYLLTRFKEIILPIILAIIIAYIINPIVNKIQRRVHLPRTIIILTVYLIILAFIILIPIVVIPKVSENFESLRVNTQQIITSVESALGQQYTVLGFTIHPSLLASQVVSGLQGLLQPVVGQTVTLVMRVITSFIWIVFIFLVSFYLIKDGFKLEDWFMSHLPGNYLPDYKWIRDEINQIWGAFFRGQILLSVIVASIFIVIGLIIGLPFALAMGILAGILEFLPSVGHAIWLIIAALLAFFLGSTYLPLQHWVFTLIVIGLHLIFEQFDLNYLIPRIIGSRVHLPPVVVIIGIVTGALLIGVIGIPLAAPTIASARVIGRYIFANLLDTEWKPVSTVEPLPPPKTYWWQRSRKKENLS